MMFDVTQHVWSGEILDAVGLKPDHFARPLPSGSVVGRIPPSVARSLQLAETAFVVTGGHDQPCGALGAGATEPGVAMYATGSVECIAPAFAEAVFAEELRDGNLCTYDHTVPGMYTTVAFSLTGGNLLKWFRDEFGAMETAEARARGINPYEMLLESAAREPTRLLVLPYFTPSGTPHFDLDTPGAIVGLRLSTTRGEILRALLEGVAFEMRMNMDILERVGCRIREFRAIGGGARSDFWTQLKADVAGKPIIPLTVTEAGCLGVAMLACAADRGVPVTDVVAEWVKTGPPCHPDPQNAEWYDRRFADYCKLYPAVRDLVASGKDIHRSAHD
jgi:xylulokinase